MKAKSLTDSIMRHVELDTDEKQYWGEVFLDIIWPDENEEGAPCLGSDDFVPTPADTFDALTVLSRSLAVHEGWRCPFRIGDVVEGDDLSGEVAAVHYDRETIEVLPFDAIEHGKAGPLIEREWCMLRRIQEPLAAAMPTAQSFATDIAEQKRPTFIDEILKTGPVDNAQRVFLSAYVTMLEGMVKGDDQ